jgi:hypothetical protein
MRKKLWVFGLLAVVIVTVIALFLTPTYKFQYLKLEDCTEVTIVEFKSLSDRGIAFTEGHYAENSLPANGWVYSNLSGFDAMFDAIITCEKQQVRINYYEGYLKKLGNPTNLEQKLTSSDEYSELKKSNHGKLFRFY